MKSEMMMTEVFIADDGEVFGDEDSCIMYERECKFIDFLEKHPDVGEFVKDNIDLVNKHFHKSTDWI